MRVDREAMEKAAEAALSMQRYSWEQGVLAQAFLELGWTKRLVPLCVEAVNRQGADGRCALMGPNEASVDACAVGEALYWAAEMTKDPVLQEGEKRLLDWALEGAPRNENAVIFHRTDSSCFWADSFYMVPPYLAARGYYAEALRQIRGWWDALYSEEQGLVSHIWDDREKRFVRSAVWGGGNGWAAAGIARVIEFLPAEFARDRDDLIRREQALLTQMAQFQLDDGTFRDVLDDPASFREVNAGQMFACAVWTGVCGGWLPETLLEPAERALAAAAASMDAFGFIRNVCGSPDFKRPGISAEGQAFFLLAAAAREKWERSTAKAEG